MVNGVGVGIGIGVGIGNGSMVSGAGFMRTARETSDVAMRVRGWCLQQPALQEIVWMRFHVRLCGRVLFHGLLKLLQRHVSGDA